MSRVLVTGGTGYVGQFIVEGLLDAGYAVTVAGRQPPREGLFSRPVAFRALDLDPTADHAALFDGIDHCVHAAFHHEPGKYRGGEGDDPETFRRLNEGGTAALFAAAREAGVMRALFLSTRAVYGPKTPGTTLTEDLACEPDTLYGAVKLAGERALAGLSRDDFITVSLRVTGVYGQPRPGAWHKWRDLFSDYLAGQPIAPRAGTEVHGQDVAAAVKRVLESDRDAVNGRAFNVSDLLVDRHDLLRRLGEATGATHALPERAEAEAINVMDCARLRALGWRPGGLERLGSTVRSAADR